MKKWPWFICVSERRVEMKNVSTVIASISIMYFSLFTDKWVHVYTRTTKGNRLYF